MRRHFTLTLFLLFIFTLTINAQSKWIEDSQMNFKIQIPSNYQASQFYEGSDKIHAFLSPDKNVAVRIRSFNVNDNVSLDNIISSFANNIIKGASQVVNQKHSLNGMDGGLAAYRWRYNNINVIIAAFYTIQNGNAYIIWSLIPENLFAIRNSESDAITNTFSVTAKQTQNNQRLITDNVVNNSSYIFTTYVSDDAFLEYQIPTTATLKSSEAGTSIWNILLNNGESVNMVIQNIFKQTQFEEFTAEQISSIRNRGAKIISQKKEIINNLNLFQYEYEYNNNSFIYTAIDGPVSYFLIGLVGVSKHLTDLREIHNQAHISVRETSASQNRSNTDLSSRNSAGNLNPPSAIAKKPFTPLESDIYPLKITSVALGSQLNTVAVSIQQKSTLIDPSQTTIHLVANHNGKDNGGNFIVKWYSITHGCLVAQDDYEPKINGLNKIHSFIENRLGKWPTGDYKIEIWHMGRMLAEEDFSIGQKQIVQNNHPQQPPVSKTINTSSNTPPKTTSGSSTAKESKGVKKIMMDNKTYGYDFASGRLRTDYNPEPDVMNRPWCTPLPALTGNWAKTGKYRMEEVNKAPASGYLSDGKDFIDCAEAPLNEVLVFKLNNGKFAKLMIINDQQTKTSTGCEHKITCLVEYPAF